MYVWLWSAYNVKQHSESHNWPINHQPLVYVSADLPVILSGEYYAFMDPLKIVWSGGSVKMWKLSDISGKTNALEGVSGICGYFPDCHDFHGKTLFRFPLRKQSSDLSHECCTMERLRSILQALKEEAKYLILFLRSVQSIEVYEISESGKQQKIFNVNVTNTFLRQKRQRELREFEIKIKRKFVEKPACGWLSGIVSFTSQFTVVVAEQGMAECEYEWLVVQQVGSTSEEVLDMVKLFNNRGESVLPWVGTAVELGGPQVLKSGRIFCFLPMPFEKLSPLPVHVNGTFAVSKDRQSLKWPTVERQSDSGAQWNELLTKFCLSSCYKQLLVSLTLERAMSPSVSYAAWPDPSVVNESEWKSLLVPLFSTLFRECTLHSSAKGGQWVTLDEAVLTPENSITPESVTSCLLKCDLKVIDTTSLMWKVFHFCSDEIKSRSLDKCISPDFVVETLKRNPACYKVLECHLKLELLSYCMHVREYSALENLELLPLANGNFVQFQQRSTTNEVYLCTSEFPSFLLPSLENRLVNVDDNLQSHFNILAASGSTQVCEMTLQTVATLLLQSSKKVWSVNQYKFFWNWVQSHDLSYFNGCPVVPILSDGRRILSVNLSAQKAEAVLITESNNDRLTAKMLKCDCRLSSTLTRRFSREGKRKEGNSEVHRYTSLVVAETAQNCRLLMVRALGFLKHCIHEHAYSMIKALALDGTLALCNRLGYVSKFLLQSLVKYTYQVNVI